MGNITDKEIYLHLKHIQNLIALAAGEGFNPQSGTWAEELFKTNQTTSDILQDRTGHYAGHTLEEVK